MCATTVWNGTTHHDDYLQLTAGGGHPGQPGYLPVVGYTIQADDGEGSYRISDSSIQKTDGIKSKKEDGLGVLVYVNDTLIGSATSVSTSGLLANFDRELGELSVGDTIWVLINPLSNQNYDSFKGFDFSIEKSIPLLLLAGTAAANSATVVPEPNTAALLFLGGLGLWLRPRRKQP